MQHTLFKVTTPHVTGFQYAPDKERCEDMVIHSYYYNRDLNPQMPMQIEETAYVSQR